MFDTTMKQYFLGFGEQKKCIIFFDRLRTQCRLFEKRNLKTDTLTFLEGEWLYHSQMVHFEPLMDAKIPV